MPLKFIKKSASMPGERRGNDPDYEEVGPVSIRITATTEVRGDGRHCEVCGAAQAAVRCDSCAGQVFCAACDDVFHKHPRRTQHTRKSLEGSRPPLPPKAGEGGQTVPPPQPPPRRNKRTFLGGGGFSRKDQSNSVESAESGGGGGRTIMGSLKRFMGSRPLPPPPGAAHNRGDTNALGGSGGGNLIRSITSPNLANDNTDPMLTVAIPQTVVDLGSGGGGNNVMGGRKYTAPAPPLQSNNPPYPALLPRPPFAPSHGHQRKMSLQQAPSQREEKRSMVDGGCWDAQGRYRSQSVSDEQWSQLLAAQGHAPPPPPPPADPSTNQRSRFNTVGGGVTNNRAGPGRGMMSSASVCDLNSLAQQQPQHLHQQQHMQQHQLMPHMGGMHQSGSFQQLNMVPYTGGMMWAPPPCEMCHPPPPMYPPPLPSHGMKRAASNISMNMSSASSDVTGYPWQPHMHHHMAPPMYPGYYPQPPPHMMHNSMQGSSISIPDSMAAFSKVTSSPAPSVRSSSRRSHKSSKSRSFSTADMKRRTRSNHRSETDDSTTSSPSVEEELHNSSAKPGYPGGPLAWQCDHCTFINQAGTKMCGMCSKTPGAGSHQRTNRRVSERRRSEHGRYVQRRNNENDDDDGEPSDYENDGKHNNIQYNNNRDNRRDKSSKSSTTGRNKKKLRKRGGSSGSASDVVEELERQLSDMKVSKSRGPEYEGISSRLKERERDKDRERGSRKREGLSGRYKSRSRNASERSRTPGRPSPEESQSAQGSPRDDSPQDDQVFAAFQSEEKKPENNNSNSNEGTLVGPGNSDETILVTEFRKSKSDSRIRRGKSAISSRASTPGPVCEIHHAEEEILPVIELMEVVKPLDPKPQTDYLDLPKPKEKSPSPFRQNSHPDTAEEPSFANTLDDIATMGTNEVADLDFYMDERPLSAMPVNIDDIQHFIPTARYVEPLSQNEVKETALISEHEDVFVDKVHSTSIKVEVSEGNKKVYVPEEVQAVPETQIKPADLQSEGEYKPKVDVEQRAQTSEHLSKKDEQVLEIIQNEVIEEPVDGKAYDDEFVQSEFPEEVNDEGETSEYETNDDVPKILEVSQDHQGDEMHEHGPNHGSLEDINIRPSTSFASLTGLGSMPSRDRQFTPLSFSSSDAAFYSPADSPDESLEEKLKDKPSGGQTQPKLRTTAVGANSQWSPSSPKETGDREEGHPRTTSPEGGYLSSDAYEGLSFQDALSGHSEPYGLQKSATDQDQRRWLQGDEASLSVEEIIARRKQETMKRDGLQLVQVLREAEKAGYRAEEVSVALPLCGDRGPLQWLTDNWWTMVDTVRTLASNYGREKQRNNIGEISEHEARAALRAHRGNIWAAVTESVEQRQAKFDAVCARGDFDHEAVSRALQKTDGDADAAYRELTAGEASDSNFYHSFQPDESSFVDNPLLSQHGKDDAYSQLYATFSKASTVSEALYETTKPSRSSRHPAPAHPQEAAVSIRSRRPPPSPPPYHADDDSSVYSNIVSSSNPILVAKTEALLQELEDEAPMLSRDLKLKIVKAILDEEPNSVTERQQIDSDEESTIEELLAREQNPTFYEYFTAVDLDEEGEDYQEMRAEGSAASETASDSSYMAQGEDATNHDRDESAEHDAGSPNYENHEPAFVVPEKRGRGKQYDGNDSERATGDSAVYGNVAIAAQENELPLGPPAAPAAVAIVTTPSTADSKRREEVVNSIAAPDATAPGAMSALTSAAASGASQAQPADMLYVRKEDVVVHPLKAFTHYADLSTSNYSDAADHPGSSWGGEAPQTQNTRATSAPVQPNDRVESDPSAPSVHSLARPPSISTTKAEDQLQDRAKQLVQQGIVAAAATSTNIPKTSTLNSGVVMRQKKPLPLVKETKILTTEVLRSSVTYEGRSSDEGDEESVSVTTGRLSLTLSHSSDKDGAIDVTAATVQREEVQTELTPRVRTPVGAGETKPDGRAKVAVQSASLTGTNGKAQSSVRRKTDIRHIATLERQEQQRLQANDPDAGAYSPIGDKSVLELPAEEKVSEADAEVAPQEATAPSEQTAREGDKEDEKSAVGASVAPKQPPVKKASTIIGKAIAKAMARESTVKEGSVGREGSPGSGGVYSPEPDDYSSRGSTPASLTQDSTVASSSQLDSADSTPVSTTPASNTPRSTPDLTEDVSATMQEAVDSEDEELLRSLDTIPEEEEISERTESGRVVSRASSRNVRLPFHPTSVVRFGTSNALQPTTGNVPPVSFSEEETNKQAATPLLVSKETVISSSEVEDKPPADAGGGTDSDHYQDSRLSERSDDNPEEDSDSSTPHQVDIDGDDNSLALIPQSTADVILPDDRIYNETAVDDHKFDQSAVYDHSEVLTSQSTNHYYNTTGAKQQKNTYYNDSAAVALAREQETIHVDLNDYESMYSIKRELDQLRESSSEVSEKINNLGTRNRIKGPVKNIGPANEIKPALKTSASTSAVEGKKTEESDSLSSPLTGAQMLAEESANTVKRSPKKTSLANSSTTPDVASEPCGSTEQTNAQQTAKNTVPKAKAAKGKRKTGKPESEYYSSNDQTDGSKSNEDNTVVQNTSPTDQTEKAQKKPGTSKATSQPSSLNKETEGNTKSLELKPATDSKPDSTESKVYASAKSKPNSTESKLNVSELKTQTPATLTVKPKTPTPASALKKTELRSSGSGPSAFSAPISGKMTSGKLRPVIDSSGESEDEDRLVNTQRVSLERHQLLPNLLTKLESLKGREPDYQEVQELKQQITDLKKSLQAQMSDDDRDHDTKSPLPRIRVQSGANTPTISVEPPPADGGEGLLKPRTEEESTQYEQLRFDRTVRRLLAEGQAGSYEKAELAAHLLSLSFDEEDSIAAAQECSSIYGALHFLQQDCELCAEKFPMKNMVSMLYCTHRCCIGCAKTYFTYQIKTKNIRELRCPFCNEPNIDTSEESMDEYFNHLDILLKGIVDEETHELFQRKLRDLTLMSDPNFRWCNKCSSGFIANPRVRKLICPDCKDVTCAHCRLPWEAQHEGISCDAFTKWKHENDPEAQAQGVAKHLAENGITCPKCRFQYSLAKGGCMHFTCTECKYEFCSGCGQPFRQGAKCPVGPYCERLGLHAHHPRNCLFYLRDKDPPQLQQLLKENNVPFDTEPREEEQGDSEKRKHCQVAEQKEMPEGLVDDICGRVVLQGNAGLCRQHYVEYLVRLINVNKLDPISMLDEEDLWFVLRRENMDRPRKMEGETKPLYRRRMLELIKEQLPL